MNVSKQFRHFVVSAVVVAASAFAWNAQATVIRVVGVKTDNASAYAAQIKKGQAILQRLGSAAHIRVFRARFAGNDTGDIVVTIEYPSLIVLAQDEAKALADPEYAAWLKGLDKVRTIISDSTYDEL